MQGSPDHRQATLVIEKVARAASGDYFRHCEISPQFVGEAAVLVTWQRARIVNNSAVLVSQDRHQSDRGLLRYKAISAIGGSGGKWQQRVSPRRNIHMIGLDCTLLSRLISPSRFFIFRLDQEWTSLFLIMHSLLLLLMMLRCYERRR